jgi:hypothetical protein
VKVGTCVYLRLCMALFPLAELEPGRLKDEVKLGKAYFGMRPKGQRDRGKRVVFGLLEEDREVEESWGSSGGSGRSDRFSGEISGRSC